MSFFDKLTRAAGAALKKEGTKAVENAVQSVGKGKNSSETFTFAAVPEDLGQLQALPEAALDSPFKTVALTILVLCRYEADPEETIRMLDFLKGPGEVSPYEKQFLRERLVGKFYKPFSFFQGATPDNGYVPAVPYTITVHENPYSFDNEGWAVLWLKSSGADHMRQVKLRKKPSTGQWFLNEIQCLSDIRVPTAEDPWA